MVNKKFVTAALLCCLCSLSALAAPKNAIVIIADGGGPAVMGMLMQYARQSKDPLYSADKLSNLEKLFKESQMGILFNTPVDTIVTDSAASGTQIATGTTTYPDVIGLDANGKEVESILVNAKKNKKSTGIITDVYVLDATPSAFFGHQKSRKNYKELAEDLLKTKPDIILGGGLDYFVSADFKTKYANIANKVPYLQQLDPQLENNSIFEGFIKNGYAFVFDKKGLASVKSDKILGLFGAKEMPYAISPKAYAPTLTDMTKKAIDVLSKNENGFFLMVEAGSLDWVLHDNDYGAALKQLLAMDEAVGYIHKWAKENGNTAILLTADHDTGGFGFTYHKPKGNELEEKKQEGYPLYAGVDYSVQTNWNAIAAQKKMRRDVVKEWESLSEKNQTPKNMQKLIKDNLGFELSLEYLQGQDDIEKVLKYLNNSIGTGWVSQSHTASPLLISLYGAPNVKLGGTLHSSEIKGKLEEFLYD